MKYTLPTVLLSFFLFACQPSDQPLDQNQVGEELPTLTELLMSPGFDAELAEALGSDAYGMKSYVMAFLYAGPNRDRDSTEAFELQAAHMANISRMAEEGTLVLAGPFLDGGELRGIYVFDVPTVEEAEALTNTDPAIQAGSLRMELLPWYGSAGLKAINHLHGKMAKDPI
ncbi:MAG: YciI family protein [Bacteroidota bacterium]